MLNDDIILRKPALINARLNKIISDRWSGRSFDSDRKVSPKQIESLAEAARWAPSCAGDEPWRFLCWNRHTNPEDWYRAFLVLDEGNKKWVKNAPVLIAGFYDERFRKNRMPNKWASFDLGAACENIYLQAVDLGLMAHPMGGFNADKLKAEFSVPDDFQPMVMIAVGYQASVDILDEKLKVREMAPRKREQLNTVFFENKWPEA